MASGRQVEAAAKAWFEWQFRERKWDDAPLTMKEKFREGARVVLSAAEGVN